MLAMIAGLAGEGRECAPGRGGKGGVDGAPLWRRCCLAGAAVLAMAVLALAMAVAPVQARDETQDLEKALGPGEKALARVLPGLDALTDTLAGDLGDGKAEVHVFYGMVIARLLVEQSRDTVSLMRSADAQACPALKAALAKRLTDNAANLAGAVEIISGSLPYAGRSQAGLMGRAALEAFRLYLEPLKAFAAAHQGGQL